MPRLSSRPWSRPIDKRWSEMILGRKENLAIFMKGEAFTVSAYIVSDGRTFYSGPAMAAFKGGKRVKYRIRVTPKLPAKTLPHSA